MITANKIARLRSQTGAGVMECKEALEKTGGDSQKAKEILAKNAAVIYAKKAGRQTCQGLIASYVHQAKIGVLIEIACETDFVARNAKFQELSHNLAMQVASMAPQNIDELLDQPYIKDESLMIRKLIERSTATLGENIQVKRFVRFELGEIRQQ